MSKRKSSQSSKIKLKTPPQYSGVKNEYFTQKTSADRFFKKKNTLAALIIAALAVILYAQSLSFDYVLDDTMVIVKNQFTQKGIAGVADIFRYESFRGYFGEQKQLLEGDRYRPLSIATFAVEQSFFGGNRAVSHGINILLYALTGVLLYRVLSFLFFLKNIEITDNQHFTKASFWATLFFIAHPLHVEVVANIKGRDEILALIGALGALYFSLKYMSEKKIGHLIGIFCSFLCGILSKESVITFLAILPLTLHFFTNASFSEKIKMTLPALAATVIYLLMRFNAIGFLLGNAEITDVMNNPFYGMSLSEKLATIFYTLLLYLKLHIFPHPLTHDYYPYQIPRLTWAAWQSVLSVLLHVGLGIVILRGWHRRTVWAFAAAFYLIALSIVSNVFVSVGTFMNERFVYPASLAFCVALAYFFLNFSRKTEEKRLKNEENTEGGISEFTPKWRLGIAALVLVFFAGKTFTRVPDWRDGTSLNNSAIKNSPNSARANCFYAVSIWENQYQKLPKNAPETTRKALLDSMRVYFNKSVSIVPTYNAAQKMRAGVASEYHKLDKNLDNLLRVFNEVNRSNTYDKFILDYLTFTHQSLSERSDLEKIAQFYRDMIVFYKNNPKTAQSAMASLYEKMLGEVMARLE